MQNIFTIKEVVSHSWRKAVDHLGIFALVLVSFFVVSTVLESSGLWVIGLFVNYFAMFTFLRMAFRIHRGERFAFSDIFEFDWKNLGFFFLASVISMVLTWIGLILLVIPGIFAGVRLGFSTFPVVGERERAIDAIETSWRLTKGYFWKLLGLFAVIALINLLGALAFGVGLLVTIPLGMMATVYVYEKLKAAAQDIPEAEKISEASPQPINTI